MPPQGWIETGYTKHLPFVEFVYAVESAFQISTEVEKPRNEDEIEGYDLFPRSYVQTADQHQNMLPKMGELEIRPNIVRWTNNGYHLAWGSHHEQHFRATLSKHPEAPNVDEAEKRALKLLVENLTPRQRLDLMTTQTFLVKSDLYTEHKRKPVFYRLKYLNGVEVGWPRTIGHRPDGRPVFAFKVIATCCYHGKVWLPGFDTMLSTLFLLENDEKAFLEEANVAILKKPIYERW